MTPAQFRRFFLSTPLRELDCERVKLALTAEEWSFIESAERVLAETDSADEWTLRSLALLREAIDLVKSRAMRRRG